VRGLMGSDDLRVKNRIRLAIKIVSPNSGPSCEHCGGGFFVDYRCKPLPRTGRCVGLHGNGQLFFPHQDPVGGNEIQFEAAMDGGGSCAFTGRWLFPSLARPIILFGTYLCTVGGDSQSGAWAATERFRCPFCPNYE